MSKLSRLFALGTLLGLAACGGGSGGSGAGSGGTGGGGGGGGGTVVNSAPVTVDSGPAGLAVGPTGFAAVNELYVTITVCAPGSTVNCQTIDHVQVDTGSVGLRIPVSVLNPSLLTALPMQSDSSGNPVGECFGFVDGYTFGSVRSADVQIAGEKVAGMPIQAIADTGVFSTVPTGCSSGGGTNLATIYDFGANGILGVGVTTTDCGPACTLPGGFGAATYYDCPSSGCAGIIGRNASAGAPFQQLPNFVAALATDNNGLIIRLPSVPSGGQTSLAGTIVFGIGTQTDNALAAATVLTTTGTFGPNGPGLITVTYNGQTLTDSFIDSGSNGNFFDDNAIARCTATNETGFYCPTAPLNLSAVLQGQNSVTANASFVVDNAQSLFTTSFSVLPGLAGASSSFAMPTLSSFDFGLPFFYARNVYVGIEGRAAGGATGPFIAF